MGIVARNHQTEEDDESTSTRRTRRVKPTASVVVEEEDELDGDGRMLDEDDIVIVSSSSSALVASTTSAAPLPSTIVVIPTQSPSSNLIPYRDSYLPSDQTSAYVLPTPVFAPITITSPLTPSRSSAPPTSSGGGEFFPVNAASQDNGAPQLHHIFGWVIAGLAALLSLGIAIYLLISRRRRRKVHKRAIADAEKQNLNTFTKKVYASSRGPSPDYPGPIPALYIPDTKEPSPYHSTVVAPPTTPTVQSSRESTSSSGSDVATRARSSPAIRFSSPPGILREVRIPPPLNPTWRHTTAGLSSPASASSKMGLAGIPERSSFHGGHTQRYGMDLNGRSPLSVLAAEERRELRNSNRESMYMG